MWLLAIPNRPQLKEKTEGKASDKVNNNAPYVNERSGTAETKPCLQILPVEILDLIFAELDASGLVYASLTCPYFWSIGRKHFRDYFMSLIGTWAGESIIYAGDEFRVEVLPSGVLTAAEVEMLSWVATEENGELYCYFSGTDEYDYGFKPPSEL